MQAVIKQQAQEAQREKARRRAEKEMNARTQVSLPVMLHLSMRAIFDQVVGKALWCWTAILSLSNTCLSVILCTLARGHLPSLRVKGACRLPCLRAAVWVHGGSAPTCCPAG